jgi:queuine tRNA-ribosyltransferase
VRLFREPDAGNPPVRFDERGEETELSQTGLRRRGESPANRHREATVTAPLLDSTHRGPIEAKRQLRAAAQARACVYAFIYNSKVSIQFQIEATGSAGRVGKLITPHGEIDTPVFMPVGTLASVKGVPQDLLEDLGVQILLGNTYHLYLRPGVETVRRMGGLHGFMSWDRAILTDSGGFQVFSLSELRKVTDEGVTFRSHLDGSSHFFSPESAMEAEIGLGADIIMAFDECTEFPAERQRARASMEMTLRWAERSKKCFEEHKHEVPWGRRARNLQSALSIQSGEDDEGARATQDEAAQGEATQSLFGIVQGGMEFDLRKESAERTVEIGFPGYAIGGLSVGEPRETTREVVESTLQHLPADRPRYLMGVGTPEEIAMYAGMGIDMMDCVLPTRAARHGLLFTSEGKISIKQARYATDPGALDPACSCRVCARYSRAYLRHLYAANEVLAQVLNTIHNLSFYLDTMRRVRHSIRLGEGARFHSGVSAQPKP